VKLAARGTRETASGGEEPVQDPAEVRLLRAQARRVHMEAAVVGVLLTGLSMLGAAWRTGSV
jgi:hypothetical protein